MAALSVSNEDVIVHRVADEIRVTTPRLHFLTGKALQRLRDGATVSFDFQLSIASGSRYNVIARALERFTVSYDVWEEKFSVVRLRDRRKSGRNLSANAAEAWCLDHLFVPASELPADKELWTRLEIRTAESKESASMFSDPGISITTLIGIFSRPPHPAQDHWTLESPGFHLADLKQ